jgi:amino acid permease
MKKEIQQHGPHGAIYGLGFLGAAIYFITQATGFWAGVLGVLKALVWPALLVYVALKAVGA